MSKIKVNKGISTIGNTMDRDVDITVATNNSTAINSFKTLINSKWKSWTKGTPDAYQGFGILASGMGYVVSATNEAELELPGNPLDVNTVSVKPGLCMLAFPYEDRSIGSGYIPRFKVSTMKTISGTWKSWTKGTPDAYQGFTEISTTQGYVCNVTEVYDSLLTASKPDANEGVRFSTANTTVNNGQTVEGVTLTDPDGMGTLSFNKKSFDPSTPTSIMFITVNGKTSKVDFPSELLGDNFYVNSNGVSYVGIFKENENYSNPTVVSDKLDYNGLELSYTPLSVTSNHMNKMELVVGNSHYMIEFADEYLNTEFQVWSDGDLVSAKFANTRVELNAAV